MTKKWTNLNLSGVLHYVTGNVVNRISIFKSEECCLAFLSVLAGLLREWPCKLIAFVLMPDHFHLIVNPRDGRVKEFTGVLKSLTTAKIVNISRDPRFCRRVPDKDGSKYRVWQQSFKALPLWSLWMIRQKIDYVHANPVKARLVSSAKDYPWTSFRAFYLGSHEPLSIDQDWWWSDEAE